MSRLRDKRRPTAYYDLQVDDPSGAMERLQSARKEAERAERVHGGDSEQCRSARAAAEEADEALRGCYERVWFRALPPARFERLLAEHPPTEEQRKEERLWNRDTLALPLILACVERGDLSEQEWTELLTEQCSQGERDHMFAVALVVNTRAPDVSLVPKG